MHGICKFVAELLYDLLDPVELFASSKITNHTFEAVGCQFETSEFLQDCILKSSNLPLVVEFVVQSTLDARIHFENQLGANDMFFLSKQMSCSS